VQAVAQTPDAPLDRVTPRESVLDDASGAPVAIADLEASRPVALGTQADIYCYGYIGEPDEIFPAYIASHEDVEAKYVPRLLEFGGSAAEGDLVYVSGGVTEGLVAGDTYVLVVPQDLKYHPATGDLLGRQYDYVGQIRILCTEDGRSRAIISQSCRDIPLGARLKPMPQLPIPIARVPEMTAWCDPLDVRTTGHVVDARDWILGAVEGMLVQIDLGRENQLEPGDFLTVYRPSPLADQPPILVGQIGILTTQSRTSTAVIVHSRREVLVGDMVELR
jgi:hypothetical protein